MAKERNEEKPRGNYKDFSQFYEQLRNAQQLAKGAQADLALDGRATAVAHEMDPQSPFLEQLENDPRRLRNEFLMMDTAAREDQLKNYVSQNLEEIIGDRELEKGLAKKVEIIPPAENDKSEKAQAHKDYLEMQMLHARAAQGDRESENKLYNQYVIARKEKSIDEAIAKKEYLKDKNVIAGLKELTLRPYRRVDRDTKLALARVAIDEARENFMKTFKDDDEKREYAIKNLRATVKEVQEQDKEKAPYVIADMLYNLGHDKKREE